MLRRNRNRRRLAAERLEIRRCLSAAFGTENTDQVSSDVPGYISPLHNAKRPADVNQDGKVSSSDALSIINRLNQEWDGGQGESREKAKSAMMTDTNNDGETSARDALLVINEMGEESAADSSAPAEPDPVDVPAEPSDGEPPPDEPPDDRPSSAAPTEDPPEESPPEEPVSDDPPSKAPPIVVEPDDPPTEDPPTEDPPNAVEPDDPPTDDPPADEEREHDCADLEEEFIVTRIRLVLQRQDNDQDEILSGDELNKNILEFLQPIDTNQDGAISFEELESLATLFPDRISRRIKSLDSNEDGALTMDETGFNQWKEFRLADENGDGSVTEEEYRAYDATLPPITFRQMDRNDDDVLTENEVSAAAWEILAAADTNEDGEIAADEFPLCPFVGPNAVNFRPNGGDPC